MTALLPEDLVADAPGSNERLVARNVATSELISRTLDRIGYLRSVGQPWGSSVDHLRSLVVGLEDLEFWDGMPKRVREKVRKLEEPPEEGEPDREKLRQARRIREAWAPYGWDGVEIRAVPGPDGYPRYRPTDEDLEQLLQILMRLLARKDITWKSRNASALPPAQEDGVAAD